MSKFAVAFVAPTEKSPLRHRILDAADKETALRAFFTDEAAEFYSNDENGYMYFREDFSDVSNPSGSVIALD